MNFFKWLKRPKKKQANQSLYDFVDSFNRQHAPSKSQLVKDYEGVAYTCSKKNADGVARTKLRLYVKSGQGQKTRWKGNSLVKSSRSWIDQKFSFAQDDSVVEVVDRQHPLIKLLAQPNEIHDGKTFLRCSQLFLEIVGTCYWRFDFNALDVPQALWILPPQQVRQLDNGNYEFEHRDGSRTYTKERIVKLTFDNLQDLHGEGYSPLRAMWEPHNVGNKLLAHLSTQLDNQARPDTLVVGDFGLDAEAERFEHKINSKFRRNNGGVMVMSTDADGKPEIKPLTFSPRDMSILQMLAYTKTEIANAYSVPLAMLETRDVNRANLTASREMHSKDAILPRCDALEIVLNNRLVSLFDPSGRTVLAFDNPSPEDRELDIQEQNAQASQLTTLVTGSVITQNEARAELNLDPVDNGDQLIGSVVVNITDTDNAPSAPADDKPETTETEEELETTPANTLSGGQIQSATAIVAACAAGQLPRDAAIGQLEVLLNLTAEQAERVLGSVGLNQPKEDSEPVNQPEPTVQEDSEPADGKGVLILPSGCECKAVKLPDGKKMVPILVRHFIRQQRQVLGSLQKSVSKKALPDKFVPLEKWSEELANELMPVVELYVSEGGSKLLADVGASADLFNVADPNVQKWLQQYVFKFAESTTSTTTKLLNDALAQVRSELTEGLASGDAVNALTRRIQGVFENATKTRAQLISKTESQRAYIQGFQKSAVESGVVEKFKHLTSSDPCPVCAPLNGKLYKLTDDLPPYSTHPGCECGVEAVLLDD